MPRLEREHKEAQVAKKTKSNGEEMKEIGLLAVAHDEHEGLLTVGASERAHGGCRVSRGGQARARAAVGTERKPWARVGDPRGGLKATKALTLELCQLSSGSPTLSLSADSAEQGPHGRGQGAPSLGKKYPQSCQFLAGQQLVCRVPK